MSYTPTLADAELEAAIAVEIELCMHAVVRQEAVDAFHRAVSLHAQRTPEMVEHLERMRGLRRADRVAMEAEMVRL